MSKMVEANFMDLWTGKSKPVKEIYYCHCCRQQRNCYKDSRGKVCCDICGTYLGFKD